jgi:hypothetical protein
MHKQSARRGHGRSSQPWTGNEMNTYADDLATLEGLDLSSLLHVGHSTEGGEVARYIDRPRAVGCGRADRCSAATDCQNASKSKWNAA